MACSRCGVKKLTPPTTPALRTVKVSTPNNAKFNRISAKEKFVVDTPAGGLTLEVGKTYVLPVGQVNELLKEDAPIWILK